MIILRLRLATLKSFGNVFSGFIISRFLESLFPEDSPWIEKRAIKPFYIVKKRKFKLKNRSNTQLKPREERIYILDKNIPAGFTANTEVVLYSRDAKKQWYKVINNLMSRKDPKMENEIVYTFIKEIKNPIEKTENAKRFHISFKTPTTFKIDNDKFFPFPDPSILFNDLLNIWKTIYMKKPLDNIENTESFEKQVHIVAHRLKAKEFRNPYTDENFTCFTGWCIIEAEETARIVSKLLSLAKYVNIGWGRHMGFGVVEIQTIT